MLDTDERMKTCFRRAKHLQREITGRLIVLLSGLTISFGFPMIALIKIFSNTGQGEIPGLYGSALLFGNAGGYVLVAVISFSLASFFTLLLLKRHRRKNDDSK